MSMVCGLDLHRQQITFDALSTESGEVWRGRVWQPDRERFRRWLNHDVAGRADGQPVAMAVEGCTGWRYVVEEIAAAGFEAHVAEPADTQAARGRKHRAKTDRSDARLLRELLQRGELAESWIPPTIVLEWRERVRLYKSLTDQRRMWIQRIHAELFQHGVAVPEAAITSPSTRALLAGDNVTLSTAARQRIRIGYAMIDAGDAEAIPLGEQLRRFGMRQPACRTLVKSVYGIGGLTAVAIGASSATVVASRLVTGGAPHRVRRLGRLLRSASCRWPSVPARSRDVAVGAVRGRDVRGTHGQSGPRLLHGGQAASRRQVGGDLRRPPARPPLLPPAAPARSRRRLRGAVGAVTVADDDGPGRSPQHHGSLPRSAPATARPAGPRAGRPYNTDATALPTGDTRITIVVADDNAFVEHPGNAGRPQAAVNRPIASVHRPSGWSRSYVLASLRALHLDQHLRPGATSIKRALTTGPHTGNGRSGAL